VFERGYLSSNPIIEELSSTDRRWPAKFTNMEKRVVMA
jgi:hypothetical protein